MHLSSMLRAVCCIAILTAGVGIANYSQATDSIASAQAIQFDIKAQSLGSALNAFALQSHQQILFTPEIVKGKTTQGVHGNLTPEAALMQLLTGTGLSSSRSREGMLMVSPVDAKGASGSSGPPSAPSGAQRDQDQSNQTQKTAGLEEIVVTGTHIRGSGSESSPLTTITSQDITASGVSSIEQLLQTLPQTFSGSSTSYTFGGLYGGGQVAGLNVAGATGIDLRGLGPTATLVLLNGQRMAPSGLGAIVDVSNIPLEAIDRIEILTDGASAIYGSDAVGGVVNIILKNNYDGASTRLRYGSVTTGGRQEEQAGQTVGHSWETGNWLLSYDFSDAHALNAVSRSYTASLPQPTYILPAEQKNNVLGSMSLSLTDALRVSADVYFGRRSSSQYFTPAGGPQPPDITPVETKQYGGSITAALKLTPEWELQVVPTYSRNDSSSLYYQGGTLFNSFVGHTAVGSAEVSADGPVLMLPAGPMRAALGGQWRRESYVSEGLLDPTTGALSRDVDALFAELSVPIIGEANSAPGLQRLDLTAAGRYEHYSDFGASTNPKLGISWVPATGTRLRVSYGTSFRAPLLAELHSFGDDIVPFPLTNAAGGVTPTVLEFGSRSTLTPEKAKTWTAGLDWNPSYVPGLSFNATYFDIRFTDRIEMPIAGAGPFSALTDSIYSPFVTFNPSAALVNSLYSSPAFSNPFGIPANAIGAVVDDRLTNVAVWTESGIDLSVSNKVDAFGGQLIAGITGTYLLDLKAQFTPTTSLENLRSTVFNPIDLKMRGNLGWSRGGFSGNVFANYANSYENNTVTPEQRIGSWTTIDMTVSFDLSNYVTHSIGKGFTLSAGVLNLFDRNPPFVAASSISPVYFDAGNASPLGRFIYGQLVKKW